MAQWRSLARPGLQGARGEEKNLTEHGPPPPPRTKQTGYQLPPAGNESGGRAPLTPRMLGRDGDGTPQVGLSGIQKGARGTGADWTPIPSCFVRQVYYSSTSAPVSGWLDGVLSASISRLLRNKATTITLCSRDCSLFWCRVSSCCCTMKLGRCRLHCIDGHAPGAIPSLMTNFDIHYFPSFKPPFLHAPEWIIYDPETPANKPFRCKAPGESSF